MSQFQSTVVAFLVGLRATYEDRRQITRIFERFDRNGDGFLDLSEFRDKMEIVQHELDDFTGTHMDWQKLLEDIDTDKDGRIDYGEFISAAFDSSKVINDENLKIAFKLLDSDENGYIDANELKRVFSHSNLGGIPSNRLNLPENFWDRMIAKADTDQDGKVSFKEFKDHMLQIVQKSCIDSQSSLSTEAADKSQYMMFKQMPLD